MLESEIKKLTSAVVQLTDALHTVRLPATNSATAITPAPATKAEETPETAPAPTSEPAPTPAAASAADLIAGAPEVAVPTKKQLVEKFIELAQEKDREIAVKLLADFGVSKLPELTDKTKWAGFIAKCDELLTVAA